MTSPSALSTVLLIDTTGAACHVGLVSEGICDTCSDHQPQSHAKQVLPLIDHLLTKHQLTPRDLTGIVYTQGPGAFTGIRIGISVVQGLALALQIPTLGISSLLALAWQAKLQAIELMTDELMTENTAIEPRVLVAIDARMQQVYWGMYHFDTTGNWQTIQPDAVGLPEQLPFYDIAIGDGVTLLPPSAQQLASPHLTDREINLSQLWHLAQQGLAHQRFHWTTELALPVYIRPESALIYK